MPCLPRVAELGHGALLAVRDEDRVETEASGAVRLLGDAALERAGAAVLAAVGSDRGELADVAGAAIPFAGERFEDPLDVPTLGPTGGFDAGPAAERLDLESGVLAEHPRIRRADLAAEQRLAAGVLEERAARLGRIVVGVEELDRPAGESVLELAPLVLVARAQD
jgi:hypothetical protein